MKRIEMVFTHPIYLLAMKGSVEQELILFTKGK